MRVVKKITSLSWENIIVRQNSIFSLIAGENQQIIKVELKWAHVSES